MTTAGLNGRLARLQATLKPGTDHCRACGLRHVQPLTIELIRRLIGPVSQDPTVALAEAAQQPAPRLCLCDPCCGDPRNRWLAQRSHGMDVGPTVAPGGASGFNASRRGDA